MAQPKFVSRPRRKVIRGKPLNPNAAIEMGYYAALAKLVRDMSNGVKADLEAFFKEPHAEEYFATDASVSAQAKLLMNALLKRFQTIFDLAARPLASTMVHAENKTSASGVHASLQEISKGLSFKTTVISGDIKEVLNASIQENVGLIKSISSEYLTQVQGAVMRSITTGNGLADLQPFLEQQEGITLRRARIIARDQTRKAYSNLNFARMDKAGITKYEWLHSAGGQKPRKLHQRMSGKIYSIDNPPVIDEKTGQRGKPGDLINCRCRALPVIEFEE